MAPSRRAPQDEPRALTRSLVSRLRYGDVRAGELLHELYYEAILRYCRHRLSHAEDAEDAVQNAFVSVLASQEIPDDFRAWLYTIARNECNMALRRRARQKDGEALPPESRIVARTSGVATKLGRSEQRSRVRGLLMELPEMYREPLYLRYVHGLSWREIGQVLDISETVVKSRLCEGLEKLRGDVSQLEQK